MRDAGKVFSHEGAPIPRTYHLPHPELYWPPEWTAVCYPGMYLTRTEACAEERIENISAR